jgi:general secretion pathway protein A
VRRTRGRCATPRQAASEALIPLGSRIRTRLATEHASRDELAACLDHLIHCAGNASLMTPPLRQPLCDHAAGNYRILASLAAELLAGGAQRDLPALDEKLYFDVFAQPATPQARRAPPVRKAASQARQGL